MQYIYMATNKINGFVYIGKTNDLKHRMASHRCTAKSNNTTNKFHNAIRKYGWEAFEWKIIFEVEDNEVDGYEKILVDAFRGEDCYNILPGGSGGHKVRPENKAQWKERMKKGRAGRQPALGMRHTEENKQKFSKVSQEWWDKQKKHDIGDPWAIRFQDAKEKYGISRTHFYRLRRLNPPGTPPEQFVRFEPRTYNATLNKPTD